MSGPGNHPTLTIPDASHWTGIPPGTIRRWLAQGTTPRYGAGRPWRVNPYHLLELRGR